MFSKYTLKVLLCAALGVSLNQGAQASDLIQTLCPSDSTAQEKDGLSLTLSPFTHHWSYNPDHKTVNLVGIDKLGADERFCGLALFTNSFGQPSAYVYFGKEWPQIWGSDKLFFKLSGGFLYGYEGQYKDKIPFNNYGIAPAVIPSLGLRFTPHDSAQMILLGDSAIMFAYGHSF